MTQIKVDNIADAAGTGAPDFEDGLTVAGSAISTLNTAEYYESGSEPSSPKNGALWKDTANDKLMIYVAGEFKEIELGASAGGSWTVDLSNATYDNVSFSVAGQDAGPTGITFSSDGTKMYMAGLVGDRVYQYSLSTAWDISTASYDSVSASASSLDSTVESVTFNNDGTKMYILGSASDSVYQYSLSAAWDLSTASYDSVSYNVGGDPHDVTFSADGTKMFIVDLSTDNIHQHTLSTGFDLSTASNDNDPLYVNAVEAAPQAIQFNSDGTKAYVSGYITDAINQFTLSTAYDISTGTSDGVSFSFLGQESGNNVEFFIKPDDGTKIYVVGITNDTVYQYSTGL